jgi:uncharacterized membrane protein YedE/YeeE
MKNTIITGLLSSIAVTLFGMALVYVLKYSPLNMTVQEYIGDLMQSNPKKSAILSLSLIANIPLIYYNQKRKNYQNLKGIAVWLGVVSLLIINARFNLL